MTTQQIKSLLAVYDPAANSPGGDYWVWRHPQLEAFVLSRCYSAIADRHLPAKPNQLTEADCHGGCYADRDWCCFYRVFNGGRDLRGRPDRYVILVAAIPRQSVMAFECSNLLQEGVFQNWATQQPLLNSLTPPPEHACSFTLQSLTAASRQTSTMQERPLSTWADCPELPRGQPFHWRITQTAHQRKAELLRLETPSKPTSAPDPSRVGDAPTGDEA